MRNIKLTIEYDGTNYSGWQIQENGPSIQAEIEKALFVITKEPCKVNGSGRTDAGVHARGQVANFMTNSKIPDERFAYALNSVLPRDIAIRHSGEVDPGFHARYSATGKKYSYLILNSRFPSPLLRNYAYHITYCEKLDMKKMQQAAACFIGTHDFFGFMSTGSKVTDTVRTIYDIDIAVEAELVKLAFKGNGFLYNMVRIITGTLMDAGTGKIHLAELPEIIASKERRRAGITVPAHGLYLDEVYY